MKRNLDKPSIRRRVLYAVLALLAVGYIILPVLLGLSERQTDIAASLLLGLALSAIVYEDHRGLVLPPLLFRSTAICFFTVLLAAVVVLWNGIRFQALIPINMVIGGVAYWYLDSRKTSAAVDQ